MNTPIQILRFVIPLLFLFVSIFYWTLRDKVIPPIGENLLIYGLLGLGIRLVTDPIPKAMNSTLIISIIILSLVVAFLYIIIFRIQENMTKNKIMEVLNKSIPSIDQNILREIGYRFIDPDFVENSAANALSGYERKEARNLYVRLLNNISTNKITEDDLLIPDRKKHFTNKLNMGMSIYSLLLFIFSLVLNFTLFFPN